MSSICIGIDVGNNDTKSKNTSTVSGYVKNDNPQLLASSVITYKGKYYVESGKNRFPYNEDKTSKGQCIILTLFGIAKEIIWRIENENHIKGNIQSNIREIDTVHLSIGLPPGHFNRYANATVQYYKNEFKDGIEFEYGGYQFKFKLGRVNAYAQDLSAVIMDMSPEISAIKEYGTYVIIGIGGGTADLISIIDGAPEYDNCRSLPIGTRPMYEQIISRVQASTGMNEILTERIIEDVLRSRVNLVDENVKEVIRNCAEVYADQLIDRCIQAGYDLGLAPVVFVGGGCLLLKPYLESNSKIKKCVFIEDVHANAAAYEMIQRQTLSKVN